MRPPNCPTADELRAFAVGDLPRLALDRVAEHLAACTDCDASLRAFDGNSDALVSELRRLELEESKASCPAVPRELIAAALEAS
ncbi:MAG: hypothetical protein ACREIV_11810, partial [Planctomycetaceae bacterium]